MWHAAYGRALGTGRQPAARAAAEGRRDGARAVALIPYSSTRQSKEEKKINARPLKTVKAQLPNGVDILVEAQGSGAQDIASGKRFDFEQVQEAIRGLAQIAEEAVEAVAPSEVGIEFQLGVQVSSGKMTALLVSGSANATLKVTMKWSNEE